MTDRHDRAEVPTLRQRLRADRLREFREVARGIVTEAGLPALTMQQVADDMGCSIGSLYRYYPSKDALLAALQRDAVDHLALSLTLAQAHLDELLAERGVDEAATVALTRVVAAVRFWVAADSAHADDVELSRQMLYDPAGSLDEQDAGRVVPAGMRLLELAGALLDDAADEGALAHGDNLDRAVIMIAGTTGVLMTSSISRWAPDLLDGRRLATAMTRDLLRIWGAEAELLEVAERLVDDLTARGHLIPTVDR